MTTFLTALVVVCIAFAWIYGLMFLTLFFENRRYWRSHQQRSAPATKNPPRVQLTIPFKGMEHKLRENLTAFLHQDYSNFEVCVVIENRNDSAFQIIKNVIAENKHIKCRLVAAGRADDTGQKVHNLRAATAELSNDVEVLVFADSDAKPDPSWLRWLGDGIGGEGGGARTGYRWMVPMDRSIPTLIGCTINNAITCMLGKGSHFLIWGGSWAIHRSVFEQTGVRLAWKGVLSDDLVATRVLKLSKLKINFEPRCVCTSRVSFTFKSLISFLKRQLIIGRHYQPRYWTLAFLATVASQVGYWGGLVLGFSMLASGNLSGWWLLGSSTLLYGLGIARAIVRQNMGKIATHEWRSHRAARNLDIAAGPIAGLVITLCFFMSAFSSQFTWRGIRYQLQRGGRIMMLGRKITTEPWIIGQGNQQAQRKQTIRIQNVNEHDQRRAA